MGMLRPHDIARLAAALGCDLTKAERNRFMDIIDDIFPDRSELRKLQELGCRIDIFGTDMRKLALRLSSPRYYERQFGFGYLQVFVLVSSPERSLGSTIQPRWVQIDSSYRDIRVSVYDNTMIGITTPWVPMRSDLMERVLGIHTGFLYPMQQQLVPCTRLEAGVQSCSFFRSQLKPRTWLESHLDNQDSHFKGPRNSSIVAPCQSHSYVLLQVI